MPLPKQIVEFPFAAGEDTKADPKQVKAPSLLALENASMKSLGQVCQRNGFSSLPTTASAGSLSGIQALGSTASQELVAVNSTGLYAYASEGTPTWNFKNAPQLLQLTKDRLLGGGNVSGAAFDSNDLYDFHFVGGSLYVISKATQALLNKIAIGTPDSTRSVIAFDDRVFCVFTASGTLYISSVPFSTWTATSSNQGAAENFVCTRWRSNLAIGMVVINGANYDLSLKLYLNKATTASSTTTVASSIYYAPSADNPSLQVDVAVITAAASSSDRLFAFYAKNSDKKPYFQIFDDTGTQRKTETQIINQSYATGAVAFAANGTSTSVMSLTISGNNKAVNSQGFYLLQYTTTGASAGPASSVYFETARVGFAPFMLQGRLFFIARAISPDNFVAMYAGANTAAPQATFGSGSVWAANRRVSVLTSGAVEVGAIDTPVTNELQLAKYTFSPSPLSLGPAVNLGSLLYFPQGQLTCYDGAQVVEAGYVEQPQIASVTQVSNPGPTYPAGALLSGVTYSYTTVWAWYDKQGNLHRSLPATPVSGSITQNANGQMRVVPRFTLWMSARSGLILEIYRTQGNGSTYYLVAQVDGSTTGQYIDNSSDAEIAKNKLLYTTGGVLEASVPPPTSYIWEHQDRLFGINAEDTNEVFFSKTLEYRVAAEFNEDFAFRVDGGIGGLIGGASMDDKIVLFKRSKIFFTTGLGPNNVGGSFDYSPQPLPFDIGCSEPRSILTLPSGVLFKSDRGWCLLDRALNVTYIGAKVERFNSQTVSQAVLRPSDSEALLFHTSGDTIVYNYFTGEWSTDTGVTATAATMWNRQPAIAANSGAVVQYQNSSQWMDGNIYSPTRIVTGWYAMSGVQGFQRVYSAIVLGELRSRHSLRIRVGYDYDPTWRDEFTIDSNTASVTTALTDSSYYGSATASQGLPAKMLQYRVRPYIQKCESIRFEITILNSQNTNAELARISGIALELGVKGKTVRMDSERVIA